MGVPLSKLSFLPKKTNKQKTNKKKKHTKKFNLLRQGEEQKYPNTPGIVRKVIYVSYNKRHRGIDRLLDLLPNEIPMGLW